MPRVAGHRASVKVVRKIVEECGERKIGFLTLFAFSSENWLRPADEVGVLMGLFLDALVREVANLHRNQVHLRFIGDRESLGAELKQRIQDAEALTASNGGLRLMVAVAYGGRWDITQACRSLAQDVAAGTVGGIANRRRAHRRAPGACRRAGSGSARFAPAASSASAISCCGISPTPSFISPRRCGRSFRRCTCRPRSIISASVSAVSARPLPRSRRRPVRKASHA